MTTTNEAGRVARQRAEQIKTLTKLIAEKADKLAAQAERTGMWHGELSSWVQTLEEMIENA